MLDFGEPTNLIIFEILTACQKHHTGMCPVEHSACLTNLGIKLISLALETGTIVAKLFVPLYCLTLCKFVDASGNCSNPEFLRIFFLSHMWFMTSEQLMILLAQLYPFERNLLLMFSIYEFNFLFFQYSAVFSLMEM